MGREQARQGEGGQLLLTTDADSWTAFITRSISYLVSSFGLQDTGVDR